MLDLSQIVPDIQAMGHEARRRGDRAASALETALAQARLGDEAWADAIAQKQGIKPPWLVADCKGRAPGAVRPLPSVAPTEYTVLATDGSQIPLDRHAAAPCFLLNVGEIALHYGSGERPRLASQARLFFRDDDIYEGKDGAQNIIGEKQIKTRRLLAESDALAGLIAEHSDRHAVALVDDPLILVFADQRDTEREQRETVGRFCEMLGTARTNSTPVAGYISRPSARDVVGALRLSLCGDNCAHAVPDLCAPLSHLTDAQVFERLLPHPGDRSPVFGSAARSLAHYPEAQRVAFFYLNAGPEVARIEVPRWVAEECDLLDRVHVLCFDQAQKGQGYPVALSEAHEQAVVRGPEREAFQTLVQNAFVRQQLPVLQTRKALAKRTRVL